MTHEIISLTWMEMTPISEKELLFGQCAKLSTLYEKNISIDTSVRPRNMNWQDWKYTSFVIFICHSQNIRRHSAMGGD